MNLDIYGLVRKNILQLKPYHSSRSELEGGNYLFLDANENAYGSPLPKWYHRYPDLAHKDLREKISSIKNLPSDQIMIGNGSDECIDLLMRIFCEPGADHIIICPPVFEMYRVYAQVNNVAVREVPLLPDFQLDLEGLEGAVDDHSKILFICSPNSPTGNSIYREDIETVIMNFPGIVVVDEAYINYSRSRSFIAELADHPNLVVLQTFSKAWGLAGLRVGMAMASKQIIDLLNRVRAPYNVNTVSQQLVIQAIDQLDNVNTTILETVRQRQFLSDALQQLEAVERVYPSDSNFLLVKFRDARKIFLQLKEQGIIVSDKSGTPGCENCLRITVGTEKENQRLLAAIKN